MNNKYISKIKNAILFGITIGCVCLFNTKVECETVEKEMPLEKEYTYCTFTVNGSDLDDTIGYITSPDGMKYQLSYVQGNLVTSIDTVRQGKWLLTLTSETDDLSDVEMNVTANTLISRESQIDETAVVKKVTGFKAYLEDDTVHLSWQKENDSSVVVIINDAETMQNITRDYSQDGEYQYTLSENNNNVIVSVVPYAYEQYENAFTTILLKREDLPSATVSFETSPKTNSDTVSYHIDTNDKFYLYVNGNECSDKIAYLSEGENIVVFKVVNDKGYIRTYEYSFFKDVKPPIISLNEDINYISTYENQMEISGTVQDASSLMIQGNNVSFNDEGTFNTILNFSDGDNEIIVKATDDTGNVTEYVAYVTKLVVDNSINIKQLLMILLPIIVILVAVGYIFIKFKKQSKRRVDERDIELRQTKEKLEQEIYNATHDELTKCKNRKAYVEDSKTYDLNNVCVISFDVNNLKWTNDNLGHEKGDKLLLTVSEYICEKFENVYRMGGDEFNVLMKATDFNKEALYEIDEYLKIVTDNDKDGITYQVAYGYAFGDGSLSISDIWKIADSSMYSDKKAKKIKNGTYRDNEEKEKMSKENSNSVVITSILDKAKEERKLKSIDTSSSETEYVSDNSNSKSGVAWTLVSFIPMFALIVLFYLLLTKIIFIGTVKSGSMLPTFEVGDVLVGSRIIYDNQDIQRGDTVLLKHENEILGKRIIGLPNETISFESGYVCIDGTIYREDYLNDTVETNGVGEYSVSENCYFVMGDNRENSLDSRFWINSNVPKENIIGKVIFVVPRVYAIIIGISLGLIVLITSICKIVKKDS